MKNKKLSLSKLNLNKMKISSLQSVKGGTNNQEVDPTSRMTTKITICCGQSTVMTGIYC